MIYTLNNCPANTKKELIYIIKNENKKNASVKKVIETVKQAGGIQYATEKMLQYRDEALDILYQFPESPVRKALEELVRFTTDRKY